MAAIDTRDREIAIVQAPPSPPIELPDNETDQAAGVGGALAGVAWGAFMLVTGTLTTIVCKYLMTIKAEGVNSCMVDPKMPDQGETTTCPFNKPWFTVAVMKLAMSACILIHFATKKNTRAKTSGLRAQGRDTQLVAVGDEGEASSQATVVLEPSWTTIGKVALPSMLDLLNVVLSNIGLVWVSSSIYQMTRGSVVVFSAILSVKLLKKKLECFQYMAVTFVVLAVILVGIAGVQASGAGDSSLTEVILGLVLILVSQIVLALQIVVEERMMTEEGIQPIQLVGYEGLWGLLYFVFLIPILTYDPSNAGSPLSATYHEDFYDSLVQLRHSTPILLGCLSYCIVIASYNVAGQAVTKHLSAVLRSILEACRTLGVWVVDLVLFYSASGVLQEIGEKWTVWSWVELVGFALLVYGTMAYKGLLPIPCARSSESEAECCQA